MKDLNLDLSEFLPALAGHYISAQKATFGNHLKIGINKKIYGQFRVMEDDLREKGISFRSYAYDVTKILKPWVKQKGMSHVPVNVFLGKWAYEQFMKVYKSESVIIDNIDKDKDVKLFYTEALIARYYIVAKKKDPNTKMAEVVDRIMPVLDPAWLALYELNSDKRQVVVKKVMTMLRKEYHKPEAQTYEDFV